MNKLTRFYLEWIDHTYFCKVCERINKKKFNKNESIEECLL